MLHKLLLATAVAAALALPNFARADEPEACEQVLKRLDDALKTATLTDDQKAQVTDLRKQGLEKCKLEKDAEADADFQAALKILGQ
jgi:ABC-type proline/glycine betaine transport system substrate-binding protein